MNSKLRLGILLLVLVSFFGCAEFYTFNLFDGLDPVIVRDVNDMSSEEALDYLGDNLGSNSFIEALVGNEEDLAAVNQVLEDIYTDGDQSDAAVQEAAVLAADLQLETSGASEVIDNIFAASNEISALNSGESTDDSASTQEILKAIIPESVQSPEDMQALLDGFFAANKAYEALGASVGTDGAGVVDGTGVDGGTAMNAIITSVITQMADSMVDGATEAERQENAGAVFFAIVNGDEPSTISNYNESGDIPDDPLAGYASDISAAAGLDLTGLLGGQA
jgi:hypothetical protein